MCLAVKVPPGHVPNYLYVSPMRKILILIIILITGCGRPETGILIPEGDVFHYKDYGIGISELRINGVNKDIGWNEVSAGKCLVSVRIGTAQISAQTEIVDKKLYILECSQIGNGSAALMKCNIVEFKK